MTDSTRDVNPAIKQQMYRFWGTDGELLYIGISLSTVARMTQHRADKPWWPNIATITIETHECTRYQMLAIERTAIVLEQPKHNVTHGRRRYPESHPFAQVLLPQASDRRIPVRVGDVVALATDGASCPIGLVEYVCRDSDITHPHVRLVLYSPDTGEFGPGYLNILWEGVVDYRVARVAGHERGVRTYDIDPLSDFQSDIYTNGIEVDE